jgi:SulP family sulfate permease
MQTSVPQIRSVLPDERFKHFLPHPDHKSCPQLAILDIIGELYFGAVSHFEEAIHKHLAAHPGQNFLLLRMHTLSICDFSGIHSLESIVDAYRALNGDVFMVRAQDRVLDLMKSSGFMQKLGADHFLTEDEAIGHIFHNILDPAVCIYECPVRAFVECQNLPKQIHADQLPLYTEIPHGSVPAIAPKALWDRLHDGESPEMIIDVREPLEFKEGHIREAQLIPLPKLLLDELEVPKDREIILVCRGGRRSMRAAYVLQNKGYDNVRFLHGGMLAWEANGLLAAIDI